MMLRRARSIVVFGLLPLVACAGASSAPATPAGAAKPAAKPAARAAAAPDAPGAKPSPTPDAPVEGPDAYVYEQDGRRDPFTNLLNTGPVDPRSLSRGEGLAGLLVNEIVVRAVVESRAKTVALVQGPDGRSYNIHPGDKLMDGTVTSINPQGLVIMQVVNDPLSTQKQREVRKLLRSLEEAKQ